MRVLDAQTRQTAARLVSGVGPDARRLGRQARAQRRRADRLRRDRRPARRRCARCRARARPDSRSRALGPRAPLLPRRVDLRRVRRRSSAPSSPSDCWGCPVAEQHEYATAVDDYLTRSYDGDRRRALLDHGGWDPGLAAELAELGWYCARRARGPGRARGVAVGPRSGLRGVRAAPGRSARCWRTACSRRSWRASRRARRGCRSHSSTPVSVTTGPSTSGPVALHRGAAHRHGRRRPLRRAGRPARGGRRAGDGELCLVDAVAPGVRVEALDSADPATAFARVALDDAAPDAGPHRRRARHRAARLGPAAARLRAQRARPGRPRAHRRATSRSASSSAGRSAASRPSSTSPPTCRRSRRACTTCAWPPPPTPTGRRPPSSTSSPGPPRRTPPRSPSGSARTRSSCTAAWDSRPRAT